MTNLELVASALALTEEYARRGTSNAQSVAGALTDLRKVAAQLADLTQLRDRLAKLAEESDA